MSIPSRRAAILGALLAVGGVLAVALSWRAARSSPVVLPLPRVVAEQGGRDVGPAFVGTERCANCHVREAEVWRRSTHGRAGGEASPERLIAPFDGTPIRFANAEVIPRRGAAGYEFVVRKAGEQTRTYRVDGVVGGGHMEGGGTQGFVTRSADGTVRFMPFDWSRQGQTWFCNTESRAARGWVAIDRTLRLEECGDWPPTRVLGEIARYSNCQGCHASQLTVALDTVAHRHRTRFASLAINCESCHGPGERHVALAESGDAATSPEIGYGSLAVLAKEASVTVCYQCHASKTPLRDGFRSGEALADYYSVRLALLGDRPLLPDGRVRTFAYQEAQDYSACFLDGGMTCTSCHDPHSQGYRDVNAVPLPGRLNDRQCTSCHASKSEDPARHMHHAPGASGGRCTDCHMPYLQHPETVAGSGTGGPASPRGIPYRRSDHSIAIPRPRADSALGVITACQGCHAERSTAQLEEEVSRWWGELKPRTSAVAAQLLFRPGMSAEVAAPLLLGPSGDASGERNAMARFAGIGRYLEEYGRPSANERVTARSAATRRLTDLAGHSDLDIRAIALATLHLTAGDERSVRRVLAASLEREGPADFGLRARWSIALGFMGDRLAAAGDPMAAVTAYRRALEVTPRDAKVRLSLATALRDAGDLPRAVEAYRASLAIDGGQPLTWVNYGLALSASGDTAGAIVALDRAAALDPMEPIAWFNRANLHLERGELGPAADLFERAAALDPGLTLAQLRIARVRLLQRDYPAALRALERGLAIDSSDASAREARNSLRQALRRP